MLDDFSYWRRLCLAHDILIGWIFDTAKRLALRDHARAKAEIRDWRIVADEFIDRILATEPSAPLRQEKCLRLPLGHLIHLGKAPAATPPSERALGDLLRDGLNWHRPEDWGSWTKPGVARLCLPLPDDMAEQDFLFCLRLRGPAFATPIKINIFADGEVVFGPRQAPWALVQPAPESKAASP